ncbi:hypothetical protein LTR62_000834 [Meristemomyces frigidus]|uniref:Protein kinase domain-containing protein n=1 Tax=Meristemomyces frigidus TaxID=1508187 RepID=A0AAN7TGT4_9PEZI|nr:hypothetical protein LTR62_000834 [Meristemomyces frigidus]
MMEFEYSPRHSGNTAPHLLSPTHAHAQTSPVDQFAAIRQIRRSLSRSPSKPQRYSLSTRKATDTSPTNNAPASPSGLSRSYTADSAEVQSKPKFSIRRTGITRVAPRRTSPNSPLRRALSDNANQAYPSPRPRLTRRTSAEDDQENMEVDVEVKAPKKLDFLKPEKLFRPLMQDAVSPMKSSPLKRNDGMMNLDAAGLGSPRTNKRRSLHGATSFGSDFNIFDQGLDGTQNDSAESSGRSSDEKERETGVHPTWPASPQRRPFSLRKSTLQQRTGPTRSRPEPMRESSLNPALTRARSRISLDGSQLPLRSLDFNNAFQRNVIHDAPMLFPPAVQRTSVSAPKPHPLSNALTPSSSSSSMVDFNAVETSKAVVPPPGQHEMKKPTTSFAQSLPIGATRPGRGLASQAMTNTALATPDAYKMARPDPQAFHSTGLISKRNWNMDVPPAHFASSHMPDTPSKKAAHIFIPFSPAPGSVLGKVSRPLHEFGSPTTPFNARPTKPSPESFGKNVNIFGSRVGAPQLTRRGSFISINGDDIEASPTLRLDSPASNDDLPPTPTKSTATASTTIRPQSKGKSNSLRSSLFGRRSSLGPDTFATPAEREPTPPFEDSKSILSIDEQSAQWREPAEAADGNSTMPFVTLTTCDSPSPWSGRQRAKTHAVIPASPTPLARRAPRLVLPLSDSVDIYAKTFFPAALPMDEAVEHTSPSTPHESFTPPDPSSLSISADHKHSSLFGFSAHSFPPATPTGPRDHGSSTSFFPGQSSSYFANDVDTSITARFGLTSVSGNGEFSQVYRVEKPLPGTLRGSQAQSSPSAKVWAVKKSRKPYTGQKDRQTKLREVQILKSLRGHENVVEFVDSWEAKNHLYIQTEFCENGNLKDFLLRTGFKARLDDFRIWKILLELTLGVKSIHDSNFIHLDLKPANVLIDWEGVLKIADFGMASDWPAPPHLDGEGDREYIGPEILTGRFDKPADIFALGMVMLEIAGNIVLPDNGTSWQRLRAGDVSELPSLTWTTDSSLPRDDSGEPVDVQDEQGSMSHDSLAFSVHGEDDLGFLHPTRPAMKGHRRTTSRDLVTPPNFMVDPDDADALDRVVQWMISPNPDARPTVHQLLYAGGIQWVDARRRAGGTIYEGSWGPADSVVSHGQDVDMMEF